MKLQTRSVKQLVLSIVCGLTLFLSTATIYSAVSGLNPFLDLVRHHGLANALAFVYLIGVLGFWSVICRANVGNEKIAFAIAFLGGFAVSVTAATICAVTLEEFLRFVVARHAWWLVLTATVPAVAVVRSSTSVAPGLSLMRWLIPGSCALFAGLLLHVVVGQAYATSYMLAKVVLILLAPVVTALGIVFGSGGKPVARVLAGIVALLGVAEAVIRP